VNFAFQLHSRQNMKLLANQFSIQINDLNCKMDSNLVIILQPLDRDSTTSHLGNQTDLTYFSIITHQFNYDATDSNSSSNNANFCSESHYCFLVLIMFCVLESRSCTLSRILVGHHCLEILKHSLLLLVHLWLSKRADRRGHPANWRC
jgi:hypothetical protein